MERYLTKSRFKQALECPTKLFYTNKKAEYADQNLNDPFLLALADGGFQVGELAKYHFCENPISEDITISTLDYGESLRITNERLQNESIVIAEAAFLHENLFVRTDILKREGDLISLYEVKSKSFDFSEEQFLSKKGDKILTEWIPYLYDIAFQRYTVKKSLEAQGLKISANLMLVDKNATTSIPGLNQLFKIIKADGRTTIKVQEGITAKDLGSPILRSVNVDSVCDKIEREFIVPAASEEQLDFETFVLKCSELYKTDNRQFTVPLGSRCNYKSCQYYKLPSDPEKLKSGFSECWKNFTKATDKDLNKPLVLELWNGKAGSRSFANELIKKGTFFLENIGEEDIQPKTVKTPEGGGLSSHERRMEQINKVKASSTEMYLDTEGLKNSFSKWTYPLHLIDFETSMVALPFHNNAKPYEGIAFQFSHHLIDKDWNIKHATQFLSFEPGVFPNFDFIRSLKNSLSHDGGTIFRYHNHENNYLNIIYQQLLTYPNAPADKDELIGFIKQITHNSGSVGNLWQGERDMVDLYELVLKFYYSPFAKGSNSLKQILPAIIKDSDYLRQKYSIPGVYGKGLQVSSINFDDHVWIDSKVNNDPYKTLPRVFENYDNESLDALLSDFDGVADGGAALTAYNYLQFSEIPIEQRGYIKNALLRYCELDTMAMVMILEAWHDWIKQ